jgi:hypothetical protein
MVAQIGGGKALPDEVVDQIAERTDGVPLLEGQRSAGWRLNSIGQGAS